MSSCSSGKEGYSTHQLAEQAMYHIRSLAKKGQPTPIRVSPHHRRQGRFRSPLTLASRVRL